MTKGYTVGLSWLGYRFLSVNKPCIQPNLYLAEFQGNVLLCSDKSQGMLATMKMKQHNHSTSDTRVTIYTTSNFVYRDDVSEAFL